MTNNKLRMLAITGLTALSLAACGRTEQGKAVENQANAQADAMSQQTDATAAAIDQQADAAHNAGQITNAQEEAMQDKAGDAAADATDKAVRAQ